MNAGAVPMKIDLEIESAEPVVMDDKEMQFSQSYWEMQEEAELDAAMELREVRQRRRGHYIGLDW